MRKLLTPLIAAILVSCLTAYAVWTGERPRVHYLSDLRASLASDIGAASASGNLLAIRPELYPSDYRDPDLLRMKLVAALDQARALGLLNERTVVALPDHIGTWLLLRDEKHNLYQARTFTEAQVKHLEKDAGKDPAAATGERTEYVLTASGVKIQNS